MRFNIVDKSDYILARYLKKAERYGPDAVLEVLKAWKNADNDPEYPRGDAEKESAYQLDEAKKVLDGKKRILVVDDDDDVRNVTASILSRNGYKNISQAKNKKEALDLLVRSMPDLVICDNNMPVKNDGLDLYVFIMSDPNYARNTEFILTTGNHNLLHELPADYRVFLEHRPLKRILYKPFDLDQLKTTVEDCLRD